MKPAERLEKLFKLYREAAASIDAWQEEGFTNPKLATAVGSLDWLTVEALRSCADAKRILENKK